MDGYVDRRYYPMCAIPWEDSVEKSTKQQLPKRRITPRGMLALLGLHRMKHLVTAACTLLSIHVHAVERPALHPQDVAILAGTCYACHGPDGRSTTDIPYLRGRPAGELLRRMQAFRQDASTRTMPTVMELLMLGYEEAELRALAEWFAQPKGP